MRLSEESIGSWNLVTLTLHDLRKSFGNSNSKTPSKPWYGVLQQSWMTEKPSTRFRPTSPSNQNYPPKGSLLAHGLDIVEDRRRLSAPAEIGP